jgi:uncharacterized membrane protein YgcG
MLLSELLGGLAAKLAGLGLAAKAALGLGMATAAITSGGVAGVLPDPAQHAVATVINAVSPLQLPDPNDSVDLDASPDLPLPDVLAPGDDEGEDDGDDGTDDTTGERKENHGACVSAVAKDKTFVGREHGLAVSTAAKSDCGKEATTSASSTTTTTTMLSESSAAQLDDGGNRGKGKGRGNSGSSDNRGSSANRGQGNGGSSGKSGK